MKMVGIADFYVSKGKGVYSYGKNSWNRNTKFLRKRMMRLYWNSKCMTKMMETHWMRGDCRREGIPVFFATILFCQLYIR